MFCLIKMIKQTRYLTFNLVVLRVRSSNTKYLPQTLVIIYEIR